MTATRLAFLAVCALSAASFAAERAVVEVRTSHETCFVGEPLRLTVRFRVDPDVQLVQPFRRELELPVRVEAPWLERLPGAVPVDAAPAAGRTFALNDDVARARAVAGGAFEYERVYRPTRAGTIELSAPALRYSFATRFEESFVEGRIPLDAQAARATGAAATVTVLPLPEEGRPAAFTGAVGRFTASASAQPRELTAGDSLRLVLRIEGDGNLDDFAPPRLDGLAGFHVYGAIDGGTTPDGAARTITYELAPLDGGVAEIPGIDVAYFDPAPPAGYRTVRTEPIALDVTSRPAGPGDSAKHADVPATDDDPDARIGPGAIGLLLAALAAAGLLVLFLVRRSRAGPAGGAGSPGAAATFHANAAGDLTDALATYLATHLECPPAAVIDPGLTDRLTAAGAPRDLALRTAKLLEDLVAARYGGGRPPGSIEAARTLVDDLERRLG